MKGDHTMPAWVSNGPVQFNVGRDLHIHGGGPAASTCQTSTAPPRASVGPGLGFALMRMFAALWMLTRALWWLGERVVAACAWVVFGIAAVSLWVLNRAVDLLQWTLGGLERRLGGAPTQLICVPSILQPREPSEPVRMLGPGARVNELADNTRESHYVD